MSARPRNSCTDAALAACVFAIDPLSLGGIVLRGPASSGRDRFVDAVGAVLPGRMPVRRIPATIDDDRLLGGLDLAATLRAGAPMLARGVLAETDGGVIVVPSAERISLSLAARLGGVLDRGSVITERNGLTHCADCRIALLLLDEGIAPDEGVPSALRDRLALYVGTEDGPGGAALPFDGDAVASARARLPHIRVEARFVRALAEAATAFGVGSGRALIFASNVSRIHAALCGRAAVASEDAAVAARLVLAPRATILPCHEPQEAPPSSPDSCSQNEAESAAIPDSVQDMVIDAARAAIPAGLLERLRQTGTRRTRSLDGGRSAHRSTSLRRGRPAGTRAGDLRPGARLNLVETIKAAAPWQRLRRGPPGAGQRVVVRRGDFRIVRFTQPTSILTIFLVDASGSSALHRLSEAKGAVEMLLAECYVRRDQVALLAFRGQGAELLLPPTRSLTRAKRSLAELPAGGATPLANAIDRARQIGQAAARRGQTPLLVVLTDGRANIARNGSADRERAEADAQAAGRVVRSLGINAVVIDTSQHPNPVLSRLAEEMRAYYCPLPRADAGAISGLVKSIAGGIEGTRAVLS
jgi:magnesium chelatase subunit D